MESFKTTLKLEHLAHVYDPSIQEAERIKDLRMLVIAWPTNIHIDQS